MGIGCDSDETMEVMLMQPVEIQDALRRGDVAGLGTVAAIALAMNPIFKIPVETG